MSVYEPEVGQLLFGNPMGTYAMPAYAEALWASICNELDMVYTNKHQRDREQWDEIDVPGMVWRPYHWSFDDDDPQSALPNFEFCGVEVRWYKHPHRGLSINVEMTPDEWVAWYDAAITAIRGSEAHPEQPTIIGA